VKCPVCLAAIGPDDRVCPSCNAMLVIDPRPSRPEDENGWVLRHLASIMGRAGCAMMIAQCALILIAAAALIPQAIGFLNRTTGVTPTVDLEGVSPLILIAGSLDLVGLGLIAVASIVLGTGAMFLRRRDPFTEAEVMIPPVTAAFPMAAGLLVFLWVLLTAVWRILYPAEFGMSAARALSDFATGGTASAPPILGSMATLWIVATIALLAAAFCLRTFTRRLPSKIVSGRPMRPSSWLDYMLVNLVVTLGAALFPAGAIGYDTTGGPAQIVFLSLLATKLTFVPLLGAFAYWSLLTRFDAFGKLTLLVPVLKGIPRDAGGAAAGPGPRALRADPSTGVVAPPPSDDDMTGIDRVR